MSKTTIYTTPICPYCVRAKALLKKKGAAFDEIDSLGAHALRVVLYWKDVAPDHDSRIKPKLDMTDPAVYDWSKYQPVLDEAKARGWTVQVTATGPVPRWATNGAVDNVTRPSPNEFRMFMTALSKHFGSEVSRWSIWGAFLASLAPVTGELNALARVPTRPRCLTATVGRP